MAGLATALSFVSATPAFAAAPPTLDGESLSYTYGATEHITITQSCDPSGTSTIQFDASGVATGPYPGTFEASGSATMGPHAPSFVGFANAAVLLTFEETVYIHSPVGEVSGTKTLSALVGGIGSCFDVDQLTPIDEPPFFNEYGYQYFAYATTNYDATIQTATETAHDSGTSFATVSVVEDCYTYGDPPISQGCGYGIGFDEDEFVSDAPVAPTLAVMGAQAMEGDLKVAMGSTLKVGYDFTIPGGHVAQTVSIVGAHVDFAYTCVAGPTTPKGVTATGSGTLSVSIPDAATFDPANSSAWYPSGNQSDASVYQGSLVLATDLCTANGLVRLQKGGTFSFGIAATGNHEKINVRWHYSANGSAGGWSGTLGVIPN